LHIVISFVKENAKEKTFDLEKRRHGLTLPEKKGHLSAKNFIVGLLYKETY